MTKGYVISFEPAEGTKLSRGDQVHLVISLGPEKKKVTMSSLVEQTLEDAKATLAGLNLKEGSIVEETNDKPAGIVFYQSIPAGVEVEEGTAVSLKVSKGPDVPPGNSGPSDTPRLHPSCIQKRSPLPCPPIRKASGCAWKWTEW